MVKVLIIDDGTPERIAKTRMYRFVAEASGDDVEVTQARLQDLKPADFKEYRVVLVDIDGYTAQANGRPGKNNPDINRFLDLLNAAVEQEGCDPQVCMFSGRFRGDGEIDFSDTPTLNGRVTTHAPATENGAIRNAIALARAEGTAPAPPRADILR